MLVVVEKILLNLQLELVEQLVEVYLVAEVIDLDLLAFVALLWVEKYKRLIVTIKKTLKMRGEHSQSPHNISHVNSDFLK